MAPSRMGLRAVRHHSEDVPTSQHASCAVSRTAFLLIRPRIDTSSRIRMVVRPRRRVGCVRSAGIPVHRREASHQPDDGLGERAAGRQLRLQISKLSARRPKSMPQEGGETYENISDFAEIVDVVPAGWHEHATLAMEVDKSRRGDDVLRDTPFGFSAVAIN